MKISIDRGLRLALGVTVALAAIALIGITVLTQQGSPPIPQRAVGPSGEVIYTQADIVAGKALFQRADLMDFGTLYGNGAYFGPDWGTDYLSRETAFLQDRIATRLFGAPYASLTAANQARVSDALKEDLRTNRYSNGVLVLTEDDTAALAQLKIYYRSLFMNGDSRLGLAPDSVRTGAEADQLTTFLAWVAWTSVAQRPGESYSYTNNWP